LSSLSCQKLVSAFPTSILIPLYRKEYLLLLVLLLHVMNVASNAAFAISNFGQDASRKDEDAKTALAATRF
jgi:hypothetical protein